MSPPLLLPNGVPRTHLMLPSMPTKQASSSMTTGHVVNPRLLLLLLDVRGGDSTREASPGGSGTGCSGSSPTRVLFLSQVVIVER